MKNFKFRPGGVIDTSPLTLAIPVGASPVGGTQGGDTYADGYRDAIEAMLLALLARGVGACQVDEAITEALDAFGNNE